jgi:hypothetical protein
LTITLLGGRVDDLTTVIVGGAELVPGKSYVVFLNEENLPGATRALTVRDHSQGVFDVVPSAEGPRAVSQARLPLLPDTRGLVEPPGGAEGLPLEKMLNAIRRSAGGK